MHKEVGYGMMVRDDNHNQLIRFVVNDISDYRVDYSGRYERWFGCGNPRYFAVIVLEPYGELVNFINSSAHNNQEKLDLLFQAANHINEQTDYFHLKNLMDYVNEELSMNINFNDVAFWVWLTPSLQFL